MLSTQGTRLGTLFAAAVCVFVHLTASGLASVPALARVDRIGRIGIGDSIDGFPGICAERRRLEAHGVKVRRAFYYVRSGLPSRCVNLQCGAFARQILANGGILVGGAGADYVRELGLLDGPVAPGFAPPALLVVTDLQGRVQALYRDAAPTDLTEILRGIRD